MKKFLCLIFLCFVLTGCEDIDTVSVAETEAAPEPPKITYSAEFYNNDGGMWLNVLGSQFSIKPNKVKQYGYDSNGSWISYYEMSSVMSVEIDDDDIETCGSTIIFRDTRIEKYDIDIPSEIPLSDSATNDEAVLLQPTDLRYEDFLKIQAWWSTKSVNNKTPDSRVVVVMSQVGSPMFMFVGDSVSWDIPSNLPKTTRVLIDGMPVYIHRTNFSIIDTDILDRAVEIKGR